MEVLRDPRIAAVAGAVALAALVLAAIVLRPSAVDYDPATPEGTAQGYLRAVLDGDHRAALGYLTDDLQARCRTEARDAWIPESARVVLATTVVEGDTAEVDVVITEVEAPGPFPAEPHDTDVTLVMQRSDAGWRISEVPWPMWSCREEAP